MERDHYHPSNDGDDGGGGVYALALVCTSSSRT
jgi:hypothetical protein